MAAGFVGPTTGWSDTSQNVWVYHPVTDALPTSAVKNVRCSVRVEAATNTTNLEVEVCYWLSDDRQVWGTPAAPAQTATATDDGYVFGTQWEDLTSSIQGKQYIQLGFRMRNTSTDATRYFAQVWISVENRS